MIASAMLLRLPARPSPGAFRRRGFTLVEILIALFIFSLGMVGVIALFAAGGKRGRDAVDTTDASLFLDSVLEDIDASSGTRRYALPRSDTRGYPEALLLANGGEIPADPMELVVPPGWPSSPRYRYTIEYQSLPNAPDCVVATVRVYWRRQSRIHTRSAQKVLFTP